MNLTSKERTPICNGLFTWPSDEPHLIGGRCKSCGKPFFPKWIISHKPGCKHHEIEELLFSRQGKLVSYTIQHYAPPPPFRTDEPFEPYSIGLAEFPEGLKIPGIMTDCDFADLKLGMIVEVVAGRMYEENGTEYLTWKYRPVPATMTEETT